MAALLLGLMLLLGDALGASLWHFTFFTVAYFRYWLISDIVRIVVRTACYVGINTKERGDTMRKVAVLGMGNVGAAVAHHLVVAGKVDDLYLYDTNEDKVKADALDFKDSMNNLDHFTNIYINDYDALSDVDIIVSALGNVKLLDVPNPDRFAELKFNRPLVLEWGARLKACGFKGIIINITNPCDAICALYQQASELPREHVIGTGTLLDSARLHRAVSEVFQVSPKAVSGYSLGEHGDSQFVAWSTVKVFGKHIEELCADSDISLPAIDDAVRVGGFTVFFGKKYTNYAISAAAVRLVDAVFADAREEMPVSNYREEYKTYLSYPAIVGRSGIVARCELPLTDEELSKLQHSADTILHKTEFGVS